MLYVKSGFFLSVQKYQIIFRLINLDTIYYFKILTYFQNSNNFKPGLFMEVDYSFEQIKSNKLFINSENLFRSFSVSQEHFIEIQEGDLIFSSGDESDFIYLIISGSVRLKISSPKHILTKSQNEFFGELEILKNCKRISSAMADSNCSLFKIEATIFRELIKKYPAINNIVMDESKDESGKNSVNLNSGLSSLKLESDTVKIDINKETEIKPIPENSVSELIVNPNNVTYDEQKIIVEEETHFDRDNIKSGNKIEILEMTDSESDNYSVYEEEFKKFEGQIEASNDIKKTAKEILRFILNQTDSEIGAIYLYNKDENRLEEYYQTNGSFYKAKLTLKDGITGLTAKEKKLRIETSFLNNPDFNPDADLPNGFSGNTLFFIPLISKRNDLLGIIQAGNEQTEFNKDEEVSIEKAGKYCSMVLENCLNNTVQENLSETQYPELKYITDFILHDIKIPVSSIKNYSAILLKYELPEEAKKLIGLVSAKGNSIIDIVQAALDYSRGNINLNLERTNFSESINYILALLSEYVETRNVKLFKKFTDNAIIDIDIHKFYAACHHILRFACDAMPGGGKIYLSNEIINNRLIIKIKDEGYNTEKVISNDVYNNYATDAKENKSALSLAIARFTIEKMSATFKVETSGNGNEYSIAFPVISFL